ncbi:MAG: diguanylate cyclase [Microthrixaceae bacterium]|nr:diguanylate cyclase [Microthrixaceae bacterium]MCO5317088.1 diguanylate cyclase [Microthrixaceae bacterium]
MRTDPPLGLPDRHVLVASLEEMMDSGGEPVVFVMSVDGFDAMLDGREETTGALTRELGARLSRLVRSNDLLAVLDPGVFALAGVGIDQQDAAGMLERMRGVFAVPVELEGEFLSLSVTVGVSRSGRRTRGAALLEAAESDLASKLGRQG